MNTSLNRKNEIDDDLIEFFEKVKDIIQDKQKTPGFLLKEKEKSLAVGKVLVDKFGLIGGSYAVLVKGTNEPLLLYNAEIIANSDINESDYFWFPYTSVFDEVPSLNIDKSFAGVRSSQGLNSSPPEFLIHLNKNGMAPNVPYSHLYTPGKTHNGYPVLYCDAVEVAIFCLLYVFLLNKDLSDGVTAHKLERGIKLEIEGREKDVIEYFIEQQINIETLWAKMDGTLRQEVLLRIGVDDESSLGSKFEELREDIPTVQILHSAARFPVIPYVLIYWFYKKENTIFKPAHLVKPVWFSLMFQPEIIGEENEDKVIFALLTVNDHCFKLEDRNGQFALEFRVFSRMINKLGNIVADTVFYSHFSTKSLRKEATRAAISQVMARNTSHNIGAHVMNKLIGDLSKIDIGSFTNYRSKIKIVNADQDVNKALLDQIALFNNYVKCRMDYLADISFGTPLMQTNKQVYRDLYKNLDEVRLLLENISGLSEKFPFEIQFLYNGEPIADVDPLVAIPNDVLGMQAFYNILENVIRNTAKHARIKPQVTIFRVDFIDELKSPTIEQANVLNDLIAVEIYDNIPIDGPEREWKDKERDEYIKVMGQPLKDEFSSAIDALVFSQNCKINDDILEGNRLRAGSLGVVEMDASAAYLRKRDVGHINHDNYAVLYDATWSNKSIASLDDTSKRGTDCRNFLKAFKTEKEFTVDTPDSKITGPALGYRFFLLRPEVVLVVTNSLQNGVRKTELKKRGVWVVTPSEFTAHLENGAVYNHEFLVIDEALVDDHSNNDVQLMCKVKDGSQQANVLERYRTSLPVRILKVENNEIENLFSSDASKDDWEKVCWEKVEKELKATYRYTAYKYNLPQLGSKFANINNHFERTDGKSALVEWAEKKKQAYYIELSSSKIQSTWPEFKGHFPRYFSSLSTFPVLRVRHAEAILAKIIAIDERIQEASKQSPMGIVQREVYDMMGVFIPPEEEVDLSKATLEVEAIKRYINERVPHCNFILLHYSILERVFNDKPDRLGAINDFLNELAKKRNSANQRINVVVTSGRGIPDKLCEEVRFLNLSSVIMAFNDVRGKYLINYLLNSSRRTKRA